MMENNVDPGQTGWPGQADRQQARETEGQRALSIHLTPQRVVSGVLVLVLLIVSAGSFLVLRNSYASTDRSVVVQDTSTPACASTPTVAPTNPAGSNPVGSTSTPKASPTKKSTPGTTPTSIPPTPTDTPIPPTPTDTPIPPTPTDTPIPPTPTDTPDGGSVKKLDYTVQCPATPTANVSVNTPVQGNTPTSVPATTKGNSSGGSTPGQSAGGGVGRTAMIVSGVLLVLLLSLGIGWFVFRRTLMPQTDVRRPPSGARPWTRTRNPDSLGGMVGAGLNPALANVNAVPGFGGRQTGNLMPHSNGYIQEFGYMENGANGPIPNGFGLPQGMNSYGSKVTNNLGRPQAGYGGFSDGFIPPSPQIFPQNESSMIPPGSGAFPVIHNNNGFAPASNAFNAMYGLPGDPFTASQASAPGWLQNLNNGGGGFGGLQQQSGPGFPPGGIDPNDPYLAEVIRQYSQKSQALPPPPPQLDQGLSKPDWMN